jgi:hypothetical protein
VAVTKGIAVTPSTMQRGYALWPSDSDGTFIFRGIPAGDWKLLAEVRGYARRFYHVTVNSGEAVDLGDIVLDPGVSILGQISDLAGNPVDVKVWVATAASYGRDRGFGKYPDRRLGDEGWFHVAALPKELVLVGVESPEWYAGPMVVDLRGGDARNVVVTVTRGTPLHVQRRDEHLALEIEDLAGNVVLDFPAGSTPTNEECCLAPAVYTLVVRDDRGSRDVTSMLIEDKPLTLTLENSRVRIEAQ